MRLIHESWHNFFNGCKKDNLFSKIKLLNPYEFYPNKEDVFNVFKMPLNEIKVVILGQDPYPQPKQAIGYAFAVSHETKKPFSLRAIEKEVGHPIDKTLTDWRVQGVFLLNTALTVERGKAGSHIDMWKPITSRVIRYIADNNPCIWMLWGKSAQEYETLISTANYADLNHILKAPHPAAEAYGGKIKFSGCGHFSAANEILKKANKVIINW